MSAVDKIVEGLQRFITSKGIDWKIRVHGRSPIQSIVLTTVIWIHCQHNSTIFTLHVNPDSNICLHYSFNEVVKLIDDTIEYLKRDPAYLLTVGKIE